MNEKLGGAGRCCGAEAGDSGGLGDEEVKIVGSSRLIRNWKIGRLELGRSFLYIGLERRG